MLLTKLYKPKLNEKLIYRSELFDILDTGKDRKLVLVSAPAGYGKTTLISQWIEQNNCAFLWYSLDRSDNDPITFLQYVVKGLQVKFENLGSKAAKLLDSASNPSFESIASFLINDMLEIRDDYFIILDDFHLIENKRICDLLAYMVENIPNHIHIVLITRSDPSLPIARLRAQQEICEIRLADLSFTAHNIYDFYKKNFKISVSTEDAEILENKTEGWIAGLQLTGLSLKDKVDVSACVKKLNGDNRYIMDYLIEEVLQQQTSELRQFLLYTSILEKFNAPLCDFLLNIDNSQEIIEQLDRNNMFMVPLDSERNWYRYHHLFEQLLFSRLVNAHEEELYGLYRKASAWYEKNGLTEAAIEYSLRCKDYNRCLELLGKISAKLWAEGKHTSLMNYGKRMPEDAIFTSPEFSLYYSWIMIHSGLAPKAVPYLDHAESHVKKQLETGKQSAFFKGDSKTMLGKIAVTRTFACSMTGRFDLLQEYSKTAIENLTDEDPLWYSWAWFAVAVKDMSLNRLPEAITALNEALFHGKKGGNIYQISTIALRLAFCEQRLGRYVSSYRNCSELLSYLKAEGYEKLIMMDWIYSGLHTTLSMIHYMWGEYDDSMEEIKIGYELSKKEANVMYQFLGLFVLSFVHHGKGEGKECLARLEELEELMKLHTIPPHLMILYIAWKGFVLLETDSIENAYLFFTRNEITRDAEITFLNEHAFIPFVHLLIMEQRVIEAEQMLRKIEGLAHQANKLERLIEVKVIDAIIHKTLDNKKKAIQCLIEAMEMAADEKIVMYFVYYSDKIKDLLPEVYKILATTQTTIPDSYVDRLKLSIRRKEKLEKDQHKTDISEREMDTLRLIAEDFSNQEIADRLFISLHTVKSHVKSILLKLEVTNRQSAVKKAKEQNLL